MRDERELDLPMQSIDCMVSRWWTEACKGLPAPKSNVPLGRRTKGGAPMCRTPPLRRVPRHHRGIRHTGSWPGGHGATEVLLAGGTQTTPAHTSRRAASWASISGDGCVHGRSWGTGTPKAPVEDEALILRPAPIGAPRTCAAVDYTCHSYTLAHQSPGEYAASSAQGGYRARDPSSAPRREPVTNSL